MNDYPSNGNVIQGLKPEQSVITKFENKFCTI